jgi:DNA invertase Pin-like site-specific DNA recombinase
MRHVVKEVVIMNVAIYTRVSTHDQQTLDMQLEKCREFCLARGWEVLFEAKEVGSGVKDRPQRADLFKLCRQRKVDAVIVWKLDRWGRSVSDVVGSLQELQELGVQFVSITEALDFTTAMGRAMSGLLAIFAEFERELISERVKAGLVEAKLKGKRLGRPSVIEGREKEVRKLWRRHKNKSLVAKKLGISRRSVSRALV